MTFTEAVTICFQKYTDFTGRARRSEYWYFCLFDMLLTAVVGIIFGEDSAIASAVSLVMLLPGLTVCCRRLHDIGKSGWWQLLHLIPLVGSIVLLVWLCQDSDFGNNLYGANPKQ